MFGEEVVELALEYHETDFGKVLFVADIKNSEDAALEDTSPDELLSYLHRAHTSVNAKNALVRML